MSRIGKQPILIPPKVKVAVAGQTVSVEGPKGKLSLDLHRLTSAKVDDGKSWSAGRGTTQKPRRCTASAARCSTTWSRA